MFFQLKRLLSHLDICKLFELLCVDESTEICSVLPYQFGFRNKIGCFDALSVVANSLIVAELTQ